MFFSPFTASPLPSELYSLLPVVLIVAAIAILFAARQEPDPSNVRPVARSIGAVGVLTLFVCLYATFGAVGSLTDLMVDHEKRARATIRAENSEEFYFESTGFFGETTLPVLFPLYDFSHNRTNESNYDYTVASGLVAITTGALFFFHARARRRLEQERDDPVIARVDSTYRSGVAAVSALTLAVSVASMGYAIFEIAAPGIVGEGFPGGVIRMEGIAEFLAFGVLAAASALLFRRSWLKIRPAQLAPISTPAKRARTSSTPRKRTR